MIGRVGLAVAVVLFTRVNSEPGAAPAEWRSPTRAEEIAGEASYYAAGIMAAVAQRRGLDLAGYRGGVALLRAGDLGREVWVMVGDSGTWAGPFLVVDCAQRIHYPGLVGRGRVIELDRADWLALGLPERPVPVVVSFAHPWPAELGPGYN